MTNFKGLKIGLISLVFALFFSCENEKKINPLVAEIPIDFEIERFDKAFQNAQPKDISNLKSTFPFLFPITVPDEVWISKMSDSLQNKLVQEVVNTYPNLNNVKLDLKLLFQHLKFDNKSFKTPRVIALTNSVDYSQKTVVNDSLVLIALDNFLGAKHEFYQNLPRYISAHMTENDIIPNIASNYAKLAVKQRQQSTFLEKMIYHGKQLYFMDVIIPFISDTDKIGYTQNQLDWALANESPIWSYFLENELLYSTDSKLDNRFITNAPYSKFYLQLDSESPGRVGQYIGWQMVKAYAETTGEDLQTILQKDPNELFIKSKFKPKK